MKKQLLLIPLTLILGCCGCAQPNGQTAPDVTALPDNNTIVINQSQSPEYSFGDKVLSKTENGTVSAPEGSITFEDACKKLDTCNMEAFYLTEPMSSYKKYYFDTIDYQGEKYYSIYPYIEAEGKRLYVGTNCIVSCSGERILAQNWMGGFETVRQNTAAMDKDYKQLYPDAKITPNEALSVLAQKENVLGLEKKISDYVFEIDEKLIETGGVPCYCITPKLEYTDHIDLLKDYYVTADGNSVIFAFVKGSTETIEELK